MLMKIRHRKEHNWTERTSNTEKNKRKHKTRDYENGTQ